MATKIRRNKVLKYLDIKETPSGEQNSFSIVFIKKNGEMAKEYSFPGQ